MSSGREFQSVNALLKDEYGWFTHCFLTEKRNLTNKLYHKLILKLCRLGKFIYELFLSVTVWRLAKVTAGSYFT